MAIDVQSAGHGFDSEPGTAVLYTLMCLVTKQYNLVLA